MLRTKIPLAALRALAIVGQVGLVKLYTHYLLPLQLGQYFFYLTLSYSLNALLFVPLDYFQQAEVFKLRDAGHSLDGVLKLNAKVLSVIAILSLLCAVAVGLTRLSLLNALAVTIILSSALYLSTAVKNFLNNQNDQLLVVAMLVAEIPVRIVVFLGMVKFGMVGPLSPLAATAASFLLVGFAATFRVRHHWVRFTGPERSINLPNVVKFCTPISIAAILNWLQLQGYRLVLVPLGYTEAVGLFATTSAIGTSGMNGAATVYQQIYLPRIYQSAGDYLRTYLKGLTLVIAVVALIGTIFRTEIVRLVTNGRFAAFAWVIVYGIFVEAGNFIISALVVKLTIEDNTKAQIKANVIATILVPVLFGSIYVVHQLNVYTVGIPLVAAQAVVVAYLMIQSEISPCKLKNKEPDAVQSLS